MKSNELETLTRKDFEGRNRRPVYENFIVADADLSHVKLPQEVVFRNGRFEHVNLDFAILENITFENVTWYGLHLYYGSLKTSTFTACTWRSTMIDWSDMRRVALESHRFLDPVRLWFNAMTEDFYPPRHEIWRGFVRSPQTVAAIQQARKAKLAEMDKAAKVAEAEAVERAAKAEFESLQKLPTSELLRLFRTDDDPRIARILDSRIGV